jgi:hypothetical protein
MNGASVLSTGGLGNLPNSFTLAATGDYSDGRTDLLWRDSSGGTSIWFMNGTVVSSTGNVGNVPSTWTAQFPNAE